MLLVKYRLKGNINALLRLLSAPYLNLKGLLSWRGIVYSSTLEFVQNYVQIALLFCRINKSLLM